VKCRDAGVVREIAHVMSGHKDNRFFWEGIALYFQETYGKAYYAFNPTGEPLDDVIRRQGNRLIPIYELAKDWGKTKKFTKTEEFMLAHMEAGSFTNYLVETQGEAKLRELHDSPSLNYKEIYGKDLKELGAEWNKFVLEKRSSQPKKSFPLLGYHFSKEKGQDGLRIDRIMPGSVAERIGLIPGDRVLTVEGETFSEDNADSAACRIHRIMWQKEWGDSITMTILREGVKKEITVQPQ
jgi:predicted metalloprotease with PDZ domain